MTATKSSAMSELIELSHRHFYGLFNAFGDVIHRGSVARLLLICK